MEIRGQERAFGLQRAALVSALGMTAALIVVSVVPSAVPALSSQAHWVAHFAAFAALGAAWSRALPSVPGLVMMLVTVAFASLHEAIEIVGHSHDYELGDVAVDAVGAMAGVWLMRLMMTLLRVP
jgi:VanZ family protein